MEVEVTAFRELVEQRRLPGAVLYVEHRGEVMLHEPIGWRNLEARQPMLPDTLFRMASNTKAVVAAGVLMLAEAGRLDLDEPVGRHLPCMDNPRFAEVTIARLLSHTSGLRVPDFVDRDWSRDGRGPTLEEAVAPFAEIGPAVPPGSSYQYSNPGYNILGAMIQRVAGCPLDEFFHSHIYAPLTMRDTSHRPIAEKIPRMSVVYRWCDRQWEIRYRQDSPNKVPFVRASGGMISTAADYARFCRMWLGKGTVDGVRLLTPESVALATTPRTASLYTEAQRRRRKKFYGLGWMVRPDGVYCHAGSLGTEVWIDPQRALIVMMLTQTIDVDLPGSQWFESVRAACD